MTHQTTHTLTLTKTFSTRVEPTPNVQAIAAMFGLGIDEDIRITPYDNLRIDIGPGQVIYLTGESGGGKSTLLRHICAEAARRDGVRVVALPTVAALPAVPLIDQFEHLDLKSAGELLAYVGIAEPFVYLRKPAELSDGQRYRFLLAMAVHNAAQMCQKKSDVRCESRAAERNSASSDLCVLAVDEFLAFLGRITARNVAYQVRRIASRFGLCVVVATTHEDIAADLQANQVVRLRLNLPPELERRPLAGL